MRKSIRKSIIVYAIIICCSMLFSACGLDAVNTNITGVDESTSGVIEGTQEFEEPFDQGELSVITIQSMAEYEKFVASCDKLPSDFVAVEKLQVFGEFEELLFPAEGYYDYYLYTLKDSTGYMVCVSVKHNPSESTGESLTFSPETNDFRKLDAQNGNSRDYRLGDFTYHYSQGELRTISWTQKQIKFSVSGGSYKIELSDYPDGNQSTMLANLLQADKAQAAQNVIVENLK